jgi:hypothetical protein
MSALPLFLTGHCPLLTAYLRTEDLHLRARVLQSHDVCADRDVSRGAANYL